MDDEDDIIQIGKLRRPGCMSASVTYDPSHGIRIEDEKAPPEPAAAAAWLKRRTGWLRLRGDLSRIAKQHPEISAFLKAWRKR